MKIRFTKMHGLGNDFVVIDARGLPEINWKEAAPKLLDRRFGIGGDQLLIVLPSSTADARLRIFERDGIETEMCGNGIRAVARLLRETGVTSPAIRIETLGGLKSVEVPSNDRIRVDMGVPQFDVVRLWNHAIDVEKERPRVHVVSMGNPHVVIFVESREGLEDVVRLGPRIERHSLFPNRTNVELVYVRDEHHLEVRVWERGAGETMACGTGACASAVAAVATSRAKSPVRVCFRGGELEVAWIPGKSVWMTGPAARVFDGEIEL
ncbi:MAG: diaminopimelate epimerase [Pseudomonadota bacterium]